MKDLKVGLRPRASARTRKEEVKKEEKRRIPLSVKILLSFSVACLICSGFLSWYFYEQAQKEILSAERSYLFSSLSAVLTSLSSQVSASQTLLEKGLREEALQILSSSLPLAEKAVKISSQLKESPLISATEKVKEEISAAEKEISLGNDQKASSLLSLVQQEISYLLSQVQSSRFLDHVPKTF